MEVEGDVREKVMRWKKNRYLGCYPRKPK